MPRYDPRLANPLLLALAAQRLRHRQAQPPLPDPEGEGLCNLLAYARHLPACDPADIPGVYAGAPGLAGLLWEARQMQEGEA